MRIRNASISDAEFLFKLRNDAEARQNSHNVEPVSWDDHLKWLKWNLKDPFVRIYVGILEDEDFGVVRVSEESTGKLLSWAISPDCRGRGYGYALVGAVVACTGGRLKAEIKAQNIQSIRIAERAGFSLDYEKNGIRYYSHTPDGYTHDPTAVLRFL